jgi:hypothetical protein
MLKHQVNHHEPVIYISNDENQETRHGILGAKKIAAQSDPRTRQGLANFFSMDHGDADGRAPAENARSHEEATASRRNRNWWNVGAKRPPARASSLVSPTRAAPAQRLPMGRWGVGEVKPAKQTRAASSIKLAAVSFRKEISISSSAVLTRSAGRADSDPSDRHGPGLDAGGGRRGGAGVVGVQRAGAPRLAPLRHHPEAARAGLQVPHREPRRDESASAPTAPASRWTSATTTSSPWCSRTTASGSRSTVRTRVTHHPSIHL